MDKKEIIKKIYDLYANGLPVMANSIAEMIIIRDARISILEQQLEEALKQQSTVRSDSNDIPMIF